MHKTLYIGIDPDISRMSAVCISDDSDFESAAMMKIPARSRMPKGRVSTLCTMANTLKDAFAYVMLGSTEVDIERTERIVICLETPRVGRYTQKAARGADPQDVANLGLAGGLAAGSISGALCAAFPADACPRIEFMFPYPQEWKGSIPKDVHQRRTVAEIGLSHELKKGFPIPQKKWWDHVSVFGETPAGKDPKLAAGDWKDILDSWGLALWARSKYKEE